MTMLLATTVKNQAIDNITGRTQTAAPLIYQGNSAFASLCLYGGARAPLGGGAPAAANIYRQDLFSALGLPWAAAANGIAAITSPLLLSITGFNGTIAFARARNANSGIQALDLECGLAGSGADCILTTLDSTLNPVITAMSFKIPLTDNVNIWFNDSLGNAILDNIFGSQTWVNMGNAGTIDFYSGTPPDNCGIPATGDLLAVVTLPASANNWNAAAGGSATLAAAIASANALVSGTVGYARWSKGGYVIQGTAGPAGTAFLTDSSVTVAGSPINLVGASIAI